MTSLVAWVGIDSRAPSSIYFASDSRISWATSDGKSRTWDSGRKVFASGRGPHLFAYVGDVTFASLVLSQIASATDAGLLLASGTAGERSLVVRDLVQLAFEGLPVSEQRSFSIAYATRDGEGLQSVFSLWAVHWSEGGNWSYEEIAMPSVSSQLVALGSGTPLVTRWRDRWEATTARRTSRAVFSAFCDAL